MHPERWQKIQSILEEAFVLNPNDQLAFVAKACDGDRDLEQEVLSLISADAAAGEVFGKLADPVDQAATMTVLAAARTFAQYRIVRKIGAGGMGVVYQALDTRLDRHVALKFLSPQLLQDEQGRTRFITEAKAASRIDHPNICVIYDISESSENQLYFSMPFYEGQTLREYILSGDLTMNRIVDYAVQVCSGLSIAHQNDILHRDIKPANVMITENDVVKILDFGIAKILDSDITVAGSMLGTTYYMSPEQVRGLTLDHRTDIWSLGVLLYELFTAHKPFRGASNLEVIQAILAGKREPLSAHMESVPTLLEQIIEKSLCHDVAGRYASMSDLLSDLRQLKKQLAQWHLDKTQVAPAINAEADSAPTYSWASTIESIALVDAVAAEFAHYVGPVAKRLAVRMAKYAGSFEAFCDGMADQLENSTDRQRFLDAILSYRKQAVTTLPTRDPDAATDALPKDSSAAFEETEPLSMEPEVLARVERALAEQFGAVARVMEQRAMKRATDGRHLCQMLAENIDREPEREAFLRKVAPWIA